MLQDRTFFRTDFLPYIFYYVIIYTNDVINKVYGRKSVLVYWKTSYPVTLLCTGCFPSGMPDIRDYVTRIGNRLTRSIQTSINRPAIHRHWVLVGVVKKWLLIDDIQRKTVFKLMLIFCYFNNISIL